MSKILYIVHPTYIFNDFLSSPKRRKFIPQYINDVKEYIKNFTGTVIVSIIPEITERSIENDIGEDPNNNEIVQIAKLHDEFLQFLKSSKVHIIYEKNDANIGKCSLFWDKVIDENVKEIIIGGGQFEGCLYVTLKNWNDGNEDLIKEMDLKIWIDPDLTWAVQGDYESDPVLSRVKFGDSDVKNYLSTKRHGFGSSSYNNRNSFLSSHLKEGKEQYKFFASENPEYKELIDVAKKFPNSLELQVAILDAFDHPEKNYLGYVPVMVYMSGEEQLLLGKDYAGKQYTRRKFDGALSIINRLKEKYDADFFVDLYINGKPRIRMTTEKSGVKVFPHKNSFLTEDQDFTHYVLVTSNEKKLREYQQFIPHLRSTKGKDLEEVQGTDIEVIVYKSKENGKGTICEDTSLSVEGADVGVNIKWLLDSLPKFVGKSSEWKVLLAKNDGEYIYIYEGTTTGKIVERRTEDAFGFNAVFEVDGFGKTISELKIEKEDPLKFSARARASENFKNDKYIEKIKISDVPEWKGSWQAH